MPRFLSPSVLLATILTAACAGGQRADSAELAAAQTRVAELETELAAAEARLAALQAETEGDDTDKDAGAGAATAAEPARMFSDEGLTEQLRAHLPRPALPDHFEPGVTAWREAPIPSGFGEDEARDYRSAGAIATAVAARVSSDLLGIDLWEVTTRALVSDDGTEAAAAVLMWGLKDDAGEGEDLRLELREGARGWYVEAMERRSWCRRGVVDDHLCR
jgi:hypothetical protein